MLATSYTPGTSSKPVDAPNYGIASTGVEVHKGIVAVDPEVIPYFTRVYVPGYGPGLAADTGGAINGRRIDLGYSDDDLELWYSWVDVYLLTPVPPEEDILYILP
jgi:3D (Asp-Asp-Asp) domain-containing protein